MVDPATLFGSLNAVKTAVEAIKKQAYKASDLAQDDSRYYAAYLNIAREAIAGLEQAYIETLVKAAHTDLANYEQRRDLLMLIDGFMHGEILRPRLQDALAHLQSGRDTLRQHAEALLNWPSAKRNRSAALEKYDNLLNRLYDYHAQLGPYDEASAPGLGDLVQLRGVAKKAAEAAEQKDEEEVEKLTGEFLDLVDDKLVNLDRSKLTSITLESARVIDTLRTAFR